MGTFTEIPYTKLQLSTDGCLSKRPIPRILPLLRNKNTLYKHGFSRTLNFKSGDVMLKSAKPGPSMQATPPLKTACDVLSSAVSSINSNSPLNCTLSSPPCYHMTCRVNSTGDVQEVSYSPCSNPPSTNIVVRNRTRDVLSNVTISASGVVNLNFTNATIPANFTVVQHSDFLTMGQRVSCTETMFDYTHAIIHFIGVCFSG